MARKHLEPGESLGEILFGLIMTLTFTLGAGLLVQEGQDAVRELLIATVGCNIAWGIIDGALTDRYSNALASLASAKWSAAPTARRRPPPSSSKS